MAIDFKMLGAVLLLIGAIILLYSGFVEKL
jgi:hypothetical protein